MPKRIAVSAIRRMSDETLAKELSFARGFSPSDQDGQAWLAALKAEEAFRARADEPGSDIANNPRLMSPEQLKASLLFPGNRG